MTIILDNITVSYDGATVLKDFYLSIEDKRIYQIVGPKGSGKSTILKIFLGEIKHYPIFLASKVRARY